MGRKKDISRCSVLSWSPSNVSWWHPVSINKRLWTLENANNIRTKYNNREAAAKNGMRMRWECEAALLPCNSNTVSDTTAVVEFQTAIRWCTIRTKNWYEVTVYTVGSQWRNSVRQLLGHKCAHVQLCTASCLQSKLRKHFACLETFCVLWLELGLGLGLRVRICQVRIKCRHVCNTSELHTWRPFMQVQPNW